MDCRVKPGNDEKGLFCSVGRRSYRRLLTAASRGVRAARPRGLLTLRSSLGAARAAFPGAAFPASLRSPKEAPNDACRNPRACDRSQRSRALLAALHRQPRVQAVAADARARQGHALLHRRRAQGDRRHRRHVVLQCRARPRSDRRRDPGAGGRARLRDRVPVRPSQGVRAGQPDRAACAGRSRSRVLRQFGLGGGRHRAEDRARLSQRARRRRARAADRARARLSRRGLRRHGGGRHRAEPENVRRAARGRRPSAAHLQSGAAGLHQGRAGLGRAISPTNWSVWSGCTTPPPSPR